MTDDARNGLIGCQICQIDQIDSIILPDQIVFVRVIECECEKPLFLRLDSWIRAKLRTMTAAVPSSLGDRAECSRLVIKFMVVALPSLRRGKLRL